ARVRRDPAVRSLCMQKKSFPLTREMLVVAALVPGMDQPTRNVAHRDTLLTRRTLEPGGNVWIELYPQENFSGCLHGGNYKTRLNIGQQQMLRRVSCRWCCGLSYRVKRDAAQDYRNPRNRCRGIAGDGLSGSHSSYYLDDPRRVRAEHR